MVPNAKKSHDGRNVLFKWRRYKVSINRLGTLEKERSEQENPMMYSIETAPSNPHLKKFLEKFKPVQETDRNCACSTADAVSTADPVPEAEEVIFSINSKFLYLVSCRD